MTATRAYGGWLELDRAAVAHNLAGVRRLAGRAEVMAVVKANAYGAGATGLARILEAQGVTRFAVATVDEAAALREAGIGGEILCLAYFDAGDAEAIRRHDLILTVHCERCVSTLDAIAKLSGERPPVWVKVDTGLGRLGMPVDAAAAFIDDLLRDARVRITGVYSTLTENRARDTRQLERFVALRASLPSLSDAAWSLASSNGIVNLPQSCLDVVRPGVLLLGFPPSEPERMDAARLALADPLPVVTWKARVAAVKTIEAGEQVGYGDLAPLARDTRVASLMVGWADGYPGSAGKQSRVLVGGRPCAVLALSANTTLVDVTAVESVRAGDEAVLLGRQNGGLIAVEDLARAGGGVYRMLAGIPARVPRIWS